MTDPFIDDIQPGSDRRLLAQYWRDKRFFASPEVIENNPRRLQVAGWYSLESIRSAGPAGLSYDNWRLALPSDIPNMLGTRHYHLRWDLDHGRIRVAKDRGPGTPSPFSDLDADIGDVRGDACVPETTKKALIDARRGQGRFRLDLLERWNWSCAVTGCRQIELLRASHMKPWRTSSHGERLDRSNGLLLSANLDSLFDEGLISFQPDGAMLLSERLQEQTAALLQLPMRLRTPLMKSELGFLDHHRSVVFV